MPEAAGGLALVVVAVAEHALDVPALVVADGRAEVVAVDVGVALDDQAGREVVGGEDRVLGEDDGSFQGVVQLADVAGPGGGHQAADRRVVHAVDPLAQAAGVLGQQRGDQVGDVVAAVAQAAGRWIVTTLSR